MVKDIQIAVAGVKDAEGIVNVSYQVAKMHDEAVPEYFKPIEKEEELRNICGMLEDNRITVFKAVLGGKICGFLFLEVIYRQSKGMQFSKIGSILNLGVDEACRNKGIGTALLREAENYVRQQGGEALDLSVFMFNARAIKLYERLGYKGIELNMRKVLV